MQPHMISVKLAILRGPLLALSFIGIGVAQCSGVCVATEQKLPLSEIVYSDRITNRIAFKHKSRYL
jgi:hypothetical protein